MTSPAAVWNKADPTRIVGPFQLLALFLLVVNSLLGYWLVRAEDATERTIVGSVLLIAFLALILAIVKTPMLQQTQRSADRAVVAPPPGGPALPQEFDEPKPETIPSPDRSYLIDTVPAGWHVREAAITDWVGELGQVTDTVEVSKMTEAMGVELDERILIFESGCQVALTPIPGRTLIDGRRVPSALRILVRPSLTIMPLYRARPPLYVERTLEQNFMQFLVPFLATGVTNVRQLAMGPMVKSRKRFISVEMTQRLANVLLDGENAAEVTVVINVMGIEGELRDHILFMRWLAVPGDAASDQYKKDLDAIVQSFRAAGIVNADQERERYAALAEEHFEHLMSERGAAIFRLEFSRAMLQLKGSALDDPGARARAIAILKPFEAFAQLVGLDEDEREELDPLWEALHQSDAGEMNQLKPILADLLNEYDSEEFAPADRSKQTTRIQGD